MRKKEKGGRNGEEHPPGRDGAEVLRSVIGDEALPIPEGERRDNNTSPRKGTFTRVDHAAENAWNRARATPGASMIHLGKIFEAVGRKGIYPLLLAPVSERFTVRNMVQRPARLAFWSAVLGTAGISAYAPTRHAAYDIATGENTWHGATVTMVDEIFGYNSHGLNDPRLEERLLDKVSGMNDPISIADTLKHPWDYDSYQKDIQVWDPKFVRLAYAIRCAESSCGKHVISSQSNARGPTQMMPNVWRNNFKRNFPKSYAVLEKQHGARLDIKLEEMRLTDSRLNLAMTVGELQLRAHQFKTATGRKLQDNEHFLVWNQGVRAAISLLRHPKKRAIDAVALARRSRAGLEKCRGKTKRELPIDTPPLSVAAQAVMNNGGTCDQTSAHFIAGKEKYFQDWLTYLDEEVLVAKPKKKAARRKKTARRRRRSP